MTAFTYEDFPDHLRKEIPGFDRVYDDHIADQDTVLPHVLLGDLVRFLSLEAQTHGSRSVALQRAMSLLEGGMSSGDARLQELIVVSFLENLNSDTPGFAVIKSLFGPQLVREYQRHWE